MAGQVGQNDPLSRLGGALLRCQDLQNAKAILDEPAGSQLALTLLCLA